MSFKLTAILLVIISLALQSAFSIEDDEHDTFGIIPWPRLGSRSRFLATIAKQGARCDPVGTNICNGVSANKGTQLLYCCKKKCVDALGDMNNCGQCGQKCKLGQRCCSGTCTNILSNVNNCGKCNKKCKPGIPCHIGFCGYAG
ncbi:hypothetical protein L6164_022596 [Bauhinia variegata]|uniref:Uncharacterized protein n=1 Tax=Bauhinia variegata TaxID=167791 RepID=A0ACB9MGK8_BAUVA|nr:hypothetical protein L6164_022596 [Bauhinia variegata]